MLVQTEMFNLSPYHITLKISFHSWSRLDKGEMERTMKTIPKVNTATLLFSRQNISGKLARIA